MSDQLSAPSFYRDILFRARLNPHAIAVAFRGTNIPYGSFCEHVERVTRRLQALSLPAGTRVAVHVRNEYLEWLVNVGLARVGLLSCALSPKAGEVPILKPDAVVADHDATPGSFRRIAVQTDWFVQSAEALPPVDDRLHAVDEACRIVLSSGTTGTAKKVAVSYGVLRARVHQTMHVNSASRLLVMMGSNTLGGFSAPIACWRAGGTVVLPDRELGQPVPLRLLHLNPNVLLLSTAQLRGLVDKLPPGFWPSRELVVLVGGSTLPRALSVRARLRLTQSLIVLYGSTEAGSVAQAYAATADTRPGFSGFVLPTSELQVVDAEHRPLPVGTAGEVRIRGEGVVAGYLEDDETTSDAFRDGWFYPGDSGVLTADGGLVVLGRTRELLNFGGVKVAPSTIEDALAGVPGLSDLAVYAGQSASGETMACIAFVGDDTLQAETLVQAYASAFPRFPPPAVTRVSAIPRNEMGKVMRGRLPAPQPASRS